MTVSANAIAAWLLAACVVLDVITTLIALRRGLVEANPIMRWLMVRIGAVPALVTTHAGILVLLYCYADQVSLGMLVGLGALYAVVVFKNMRLRN